MANGDQVIPDFPSKWIATDQIDGVLEYLKAVSNLMLKCYLCFAFMR
jgi:hypothetical protein